MTIALTGTVDNQVSQIISQEYIAGFLQDCDWNAWYENRRTGYPTFILNPSINLNIPSTQFPVRWMYPSDEYSYNSASVTAAVASQYGGSDTNNGIMWILQ